MQGPAHLAIGWLIGERAGLAARRDRRLVGLAGLAPDADIVVYPLAWLWYGADLDLAFAVYAEVHHRYTHGVVFALLAMVAAARLASPAARTRVGLLCGLAVTAHILGDIIASGPAWPVYPLWPFDDLACAVAWSWPASDWRNVTLSFLAIAMTLAYARVRGYSPLECFSYRADRWVGAVMRGEVQSSARFRIAVYAALALVSAAVLLPLWLYLR